MLNNKKIIIIERNHRANQREREKKGSLEHLFRFRLKIKKTKNEI